MKKILAAAMAMVMALSLFTACSKNEDTVKIGILAPLTGNVSVYGIASKNGTVMGIDEINAKGGILGKQITTAIQDEKGDVAEAVTAYDKLVSDKIVALIGDVTSNPSVAVAERAAKDGMPMLTPTGTTADITKKGPNVFRTCFMDPFQGQVMATFAADNLKVKTAAIIVNNSDDYSKGLAKSFKETCEAKGIQVVIEEAYGATDKMFETQLTKINALNPDVLYVPDYYNTIALIATQARQIGFTGPMLGGDGWDGVLGVLTEDNKSVVDNCYFSNHYSPENTDERLANFRKSYQEKYGEEPNAFAALGYDSAYIMAMAIEKAGSTDKAAIVEALKGLEYDGITGHITFDDNGDPIKEAFITKLENGGATLAAKVSL